MLTPWTPFRAHFMKTNSFLFFSFAFKVSISAFPEFTRGWIQPLVTLTWWLVTLSQERYCIAIQHWTDIASTSKTWSRTRRQYWHLDCRMYPSLRSLMAPERAGGFHMFALHIIYAHPVAWRRKRPFKLSADNFFLVMAPRTRGRSLVAYCALHDQHKFVEVETPCAVIGMACVLRL